MSKYKYEIWKNILTKLDFGREYVVDHTRPDYADFVDALKSFSKNWWNFIVKDHEPSVTFVLLDPISAINEMIDYHTALESEPVVHEKVAKDNFYTGSYNPDEMEKQRELHKSLPESNIPGTTTDYRSSQEALEGPQSDDHPLGGISGRNEKNNRSTGLKQAHLEFQKPEQNTEW